MRLKHPTDVLSSKPVLAWSLAAAYAAIIFILSSFPYAPPQPGVLVSVSATYKHVLEYSIFGFLLLACFRSHGKTQRLALLFAIIAAGIYGLTDELHQLFVPGRTASLYDAAADLIGAFFGALIMHPRTLRS